MRQYFESNFQSEIAGATQVMPCYQFWVCAVIRNLGQFVCVVSKGLDDAEFTEWASILGSHNPDLLADFQGVLLEKICFISRHAN